MIAVGYIRRVNGSRTSNRRRMNCLNQAISEERIHQVRLLLSMDVDSETRDKSDYERTPLIKCCLVKHEEPALKLLKILLKCRVTVNAVDMLGRSALHYACASGKSQVAKVLMNEDGLELNTQDNEGRTPLMLACAEGHLVMARVLMGKLVKFNLEIDKRDNQGYTALLLAIKNEHYDVAHDLVRHANACTTLRDTSNFMNAADWLKSNLEKRRKTKLVVDKTDEKKSAKRSRGSKTPAKSEKSDKENEQADDIPILTLTESQDQDEEVFDDVTSARQRIGTATSTAVMSGLLFEPDPYGGFTRPPSSGQESSARPPSSGRETLNRPVSSGQNSVARPPSTGQQRVSSVGSSRFSASSRNRQMQILELLREEQNLSSSPPATPPQNPTVETLKREAGAESVASITTSRASRHTWRNDDLESIVEDPRSRQPSRADGRGSSMRSPYPQDRASNARTPVSFQSKSPSIQTGWKSRAEKAKQEKSSEIYAIQKLKQALRDKTRRKITRASTAVFRPASGIPSEEWMSDIIKGGKRHVATSKSAHFPPKPSTSPRTPAIKSSRSNYSDYNSTISIGESRKLSASQIRPPTTSKKLLHASSLSLDTLISKTDVTTSTALSSSTKERRPKGSTQIATLFRLYTDSCLWRPPKTKPASLSVQTNFDNSERVTLRSELSGSTNDLGSVVTDKLEGPQGSTTGSIPPKTRPESKTAARNRIPGSATSRASKGRNAGSAGGRSATSRHAD